MADTPDRKLPLGLQTRDVVWIGTLLLGLAANYGATAVRIASVEQTVNRVDARLWELARGRTASTASLPITCPADATRVTLTTRPEAPRGPLR